MTRVTRLEEAMRREIELRAKINELDVMLAAVDAGRDRLERAIEGMSYSTDEMKGQYRIIKERQAWAIKEQDKLKAELKQIETDVLRMTHPGDSQ